MDMRKQQYRVTTNSDSIPWERVATLVEARKHADRLLKGHKCHTVYIDQVEPEERFVEKRHLDLSWKKVLVSKGLNKFDNAQNR